MKIVDEVIVNASRDKVFSALNDPQVLSQVIPGCESLEKTSDTGFSAVVLTKVGPIKARFKGTVELSDLVPPESYTITGQGEGGAAGIAKGTAQIQLLETGDQTTMKYIIVVDVGGKLAQAGGRMLDGVARKMSKQFFKQFDSILAESTHTPNAKNVQPEQHKTSTSSHWPIVLGGVAVLAFLIWILFSQ